MKFGFKRSNPDHTLFVNKGRELRPQVIAQLARDMGVLVRVCEFECPQCSKKKTKGIITEVKLYFEKSP